MNEADFFKGWSFLLVQPWARMYTFGEDGQAREAVQISLYKSKFLKVEGVRWIGACQSWAETQDHWPTASELSQRLMLLGGAPKALGLLAPVEIADDDYPPKLAYEYSKAQSCSYRDACLKVLPRWLEAHPHHEHYARANALLKTMQEKPIIPRRVVHALQADEPYEFVTDAKAEGLKRCCSHCQTDQETKVFICWCQKWEGCKACYVGHEAGCQGAESAFVRRKGRKSA